jgi:hypothetical protein
MANQLDQANLGRKGLADGNRVESLAGLHTAEADAQRGELLALLGSERRRALDAARQAHRVCRIEFAQMEEMVERTRREAEALEARRAQSVSDDRFLARKHWTEQREPRPR